MMKSLDMEFKVFTLNCWGIPFVSKNRKSRMVAIAEVLATSHYDLVCLQEVWTTNDFDLIKSKICILFPHSHYFYSGVFGSGVCMFSKCPLQEVFFHQWPVNGYVHKVQHGDWFGGKGVGLCKLRVNDCNINVYSAHLHAEYDRICDEYQAHRVLQAFDTAQFIRLTSTNADLVILAGDLNTEPGDLAYRLLMGTTGLKDAFSEIPTAAHEMLGTIEEPQNSYTKTSLIKKMCRGKRIDYVMYCGGPCIDVEVKKYNHPLPDRVPGCEYSYSDHEAISASLKVYYNDIAESRGNLTSSITSLQEGIDICNEELKKLVNSKLFYWIVTAFLFMILITIVMTNAPFGYVILYHVLKVVITVIMAFTFIMGTIWNMIERNAVYAGKLAMEINLKLISSK